MSTWVVTANVHFENCVISIYQECQCTLHYWLPAAWSSELLIPTSTWKPSCRKTASKHRTQPQLPRGSAQPAEAATYLKKVRTKKRHQHTNQAARKNEPKLLPKRPLKKKKKTKRKARTQRTNRTKLKEVWNVFLSILEQARFGLKFVSSNLQISLDKRVRLLRTECREKTTKALKGVDCGGVVYWWFCDS